jgi:hypothetical protein
MRPSVNVAVNVQQARQQVARITHVDAVDSDVEHFDAQEIEAEARA